MRPIKASVTQHLQHGIRSDAAAIMMERERREMEREALHLHTAGFQSINQHFDTDQSLCDQKGEIINNDAD